MSDIPLQILKIEREIVRLYDLVTKLETRVALSDQNNALLWYNRAGCQAPTFLPISPSLPSPQNSGTSITFTATLVGTTYIPTGTVQFLDGSTLLATVPLNSSGVATYTTSSLSVATHTINAIYSGDGMYCSATQSLSGYVIASSFNPCSGGFTAGAYRAHDPFYGVSSAGINLSSTGVGFGNGAYTGVAAYGSCPAPLQASIYYSTSCSGIPSSLNLLVEYCGNNTTHCQSGAPGAPPSNCPVGTIPIPMTCALASATTTSLTFTIPSTGVDPNSPYFSLGGQTITLSNP